MELKNIITQSNKDMEEISELAKHIELKESLLAKYGFKVEFTSIN